MIEITPIAFLAIIAAAMAVGASGQGVVEELVRLKEKRQWPWR